MANDDTDLNWRELMLEALKAGKLTTTITFDDTKYLVTLQPYDGPEGSLETGLCATCGQIIRKRVGGRYWFHLDPKDGNHPAKLQGWVPNSTPAPEAAATPVKKQWAGPRCTICNESIGFDGIVWKHLDMLPHNHEAAAATGTGPDIRPLEATYPVVGATATCRSCGKGIVFVGPYWDHVGPNKPRHIAEPPLGAFKGND